MHVKFRYCEKATKLEKNIPSWFEITLYCQSKVGDFFQNFGAFSEYLNFTYVIDSAARQKLEKKTRQITKRKIKKSSRLQLIKQ